MTGPTRCDLLVVGAGYTGLWTALHAARRYPGARIVVVDAHRVGGAASGRNGGFVEASLTHGAENGRTRWPAEFDQLDALGRHNLDGMQTEIGDLGLDVEWERPGMLTVATEPHRVQWLRQAAADGEGTSLDQDATLEQVASPTYRGALFTPDTCALVHPGKLASELARACTDDGCPSTNTPRPATSPPTPRDVGLEPRPARFTPTESCWAPTPSPAWSPATGFTPFRSGTTCSPPNR